MDFEQKMEEKKLEHYRETMDRLTAASHIQVEYFAEHKKIEGYYEDRMPENLFGCDRLMKQDNMFGTIQLGYNPNRERTFLFANLKTSRYDTVASSYQKEMREYQRRVLLKGDNENRAYVSRRQELSSVLIEKKERKPWSVRSVKAYLNRVNMEAAAKTLPFFSREEEREELEKLRGRRREIQEEIRMQRLQKPGSEDSREAEAEQRETEGELRRLRREATDSLMTESLLDTILTRKSAAAKAFLRRINYAYDFQKKDIEEYYRERRRTLEETAAQKETAEDLPEDEDA